MRTGAPKITNRGQAAIPKTVRDAASSLHKFGAYEKVFGSMKEIKEKAWEEGIHEKACRSFSDANTAI